MWELDNLAFARLAVAAVLVVACSGESAHDGSGDDGTTGGAGASGGNASGGSASGGANVSGGSTGTGGRVDTGGAGASGGVSASGGAGAGPTTGGDGGSSQGGTSSGGNGPGGGGSGAMGGAGAASGGSAGTFGGAGVGGTFPGGGGESSSLSVPSQTLWTAVRYYAGSTPANRTSGPAQGPTQTVRIHNQGFAGASITATLSGADAARFQIVEPPSFPVAIRASSDLDVTIRLVTANTSLGAAPAQDDGATVLRATLTVTGGLPQPSGQLYALVLTYVELEPTFGQILGAFPYYTSNLPDSIRNDANPNPATLPGVEAGTDEVRAPSFRRANATAPVTVRALARFSPPGLVPFGWYPPGSIAARNTVGTLAQATDPHTNDKSRMLLPPLSTGTADASGTLSFEPTSTTFGLWMAPSGVGLLATEDAQGFDGAHRVKVWTLRDAGGAVRPNEYLIGGEEAANGDYQDYVFVVTNLVPVP